MRCVTLKYCHHRSFMGGRLWRLAGHIAYTLRKESIGYSVEWCTPSTWVLEQINTFPFRSWLSQVFVLEDGETLREVVWVKNADVTDCGRLYCTSVKSAVLFASILKSGTWPFVIVEHCQIHVHSWVHTTQDLREHMRSHTHTHTHN